MRRTLLLAVAVFTIALAAGHFRSDDHSFDFRATSYSVRLIHIMPKQK